jgi:hemoglobin
LNSPALSPYPTRFESRSGEPVIDALVERFYAEMDARGIRAMHAGSLEPVKFVLKRYLAEWLGGPPLYSRGRGPPR